MTLEIAIRYLHFISIFVIFGSLVSEHLLLKSEMTSKEILRLSRIDAVYGLGAILAVGAGLSLWLWVGKPGDFYTHNWIFHLKLGLAILPGLLSLPPTIFFLKNRKNPTSDDLIAIPPYVKRLIRIELLLLFLIPLLAVLMAKGIGMFK